MEDEAHKGQPMKRFKEYLDENILHDVLNLGSKFLYLWKQKWVLNTKHGLERIVQRNELSKDQLKILFRNALEKLEKMAVNVGDDILFYSKSLRQGFISSVDSSKNLKLITFLPKGKDFPKPGTERVVVESENEEYIVDHIVEID